MNKIRLIRIYELKGKVHPIEQSVIDLLDGIETKPYIDYILYQKNGEFYFSYYRNTKHMVLQWMYVRNIFNMNDYEIKHILEYLLEKHLKINIIRIL